MQQVMLTVLLGPEDPTAWERYQKQAAEKRRYPHHREKIIARVTKRYRDKHETIRKAANAAYHEAPERVREQSRLWRLKNPEKFQEQQRDWRSKNPEKIRAGSLRWVTGRRKADPAFRLKDSMRSRIRMALKDIKKAGRTHELVGCSIPALCEHLEEQFRPGMTWENYGPVWHVDHKRPCAKFDLSDPAQQRACFNFSNLQPLFASENCSKGAR